MTTLEPVDPATYWHEQFLYALSALSWAVGRLGDDPGYAGVVHERLTTTPVTFTLPNDILPGRVA